MSKKPQHDSSDAQDHGIESAPFKQFNRYTLTDGFVQSEEEAKLTLADARQYGAIAVDVFGGKGVDFTHPLRQSAHLLADGEFGRLDYNSLSVDGDGVHSGDRTIKDKAVTLAVKNAFDRVHDEQLTKTEATDLIHLANLVYTATHKLPGDAHSGEYDPAQDNAIILAAANKIAQPKAR